MSDKFKNLYYYLSFLGFYFILSHSDKVEQFLERDADDLAPTLDSLIDQTVSNYGYCLSLGPCYVQGDKLIENSTARQLNDCEMALLKHYQLQMYRWRLEVEEIKGRFREAMCHVMDNNHCVMMEPFPPVPPVPCLCSNCDGMKHEKPAKVDPSSANEADIEIKPIIH